MKRTEREYPHLEPVAKQAVDATRDEADVLLTHIGGFITDEEALKLRDLLWYAYDNNVAVTFAPKPDSEDNTK